MRRLVCASLPISDFGGGGGEWGPFIRCGAPKSSPRRRSSLFCCCRGLRCRLYGWPAGRRFPGSNKLVWIRQSMPAGVFLFVSTTENLPFSVQGYVFAHLCLLRECRFILPRCGSRPLSDTACLSAVQVKIQKWQSSVVNKEQRGNKGALLENDGELSVDKRWRGESCYFQLNCSKNSGRKKCDAVDLSDQ